MKTIFPFEMPCDLLRDVRPRAFSGVIILALSSAAAGHRSAALSPARIFATPQQAVAALY